MTRDALDQEMRAVLLGMALCSHAAATSYEPKSRSGATSSRDLSGGDTGNEYWAIRYGEPFHKCKATCSHRATSAETDQDRARVIKEARGELDHIRGHGRSTTSRPDGETKEQRDYRIVRDYQGWAAVEVAIAVRCGVRDVQRARRRAAHDPDNGQPLTPEATADAGERQARALELRARGQSITSIALILGVDKSRVSRYLARATTEERRCA